MKPHWLLEPEVFKGDLVPFIDTLERLGVDHTVMKFGVQYQAYVSKFHAADPVIFQGSLQAAKVFRKQTRWKGLFCNLPKFDCRYYYPKFGDHLLNDNYVMLPFGDIARRKKWLYDTLGREYGELFFRPDGGGKGFSGMVIAERAVPEEMKLMKMRVDPEELVVVAPTVNITKEWRLVIVNNEVVGGSQYKEDGKTIRKAETPQGLIDYAREVLTAVKYNPDPAWTLDICQTHSGKLKVLEVGTFSCAGLYAADPEPVITAVNKLFTSEND